MLYPQKICVEAIGRNIEANFLVDKIFIDLKQIYESQKLQLCQIKY